MDIAQKMRAIREKLGLTRLSLSVEMEYNPTTVYNYEKKITIVTDRLLAKFKSTLNLENVPLTDKEVLEYKANMYVQNNSLSMGRQECIENFVNELENCKKYCFDEYLINLCDLFIVRYFYALGRFEEFNLLMDSLKQREDELKDEHLYWYYYCKGVMEFSTWHYKQALKYFLQAEENGKKLGSGFNINFKNLYYNISCCFTYTDYPHLAIEYLEKFKKEDVNVFNPATGIAIQMNYAVNFSKLGKFDKALEMLKFCRDYVIAESKDDLLTLCGIYVGMSKVYRDKGDYLSAHDVLDKAKGLKIRNNEVLLVCLCHKAILYRDNDEFDLVNECLKEGFLISNKGTLWHEWLTALKYSLELDKEASSKYFEYTSIPRLLEYGKHSLVHDCYVWLSSHCEKTIKYKQAFYYSQKANKIYKQLMEGDLSL